ncbi:MAG TPA: hypothetical protein VFZ16_23195 [Hyphomicrobiaceae bacterium]|nr:hypothetical protein [Hyphomicrobiaceae bacterium]
MLGPKPTQHSATAPHHLAAATTEMMWSCALAVARLTAASSACGLELWSQMLRAPFTPPAETHQGTHAPVAADGASASATTADATTGADAAPAFASYRSASGHATAQVVVSK